MACIASGLLLWSSHFPLALGWPVWFALVPLVALVRARLGTGITFVLAWLTGIVFFFPALQWMRVADHRMYYTWLSLGFYCSLLVPAIILLTRFLDRRTRLPLLVTFPTVWTAIEFFRAYFGGGFPWYFLGYTQHDFLPVIQIADLGGVFAVSFLIAVANVIVYEWLVRWPAIRYALGNPFLSGAGIGALAVQSAVVVLLVAAALGYGFWRLSQNDFTAGPRVALLQGNLDQRIRNQASDLGDQAAMDQMKDHFERLNHEASSVRPRPDLIVWPETSYPADWLEEAPDRPAYISRALANRIAKQAGTATLAGISAWVGPDEKRLKRYNSAVLIFGDGRLGPRYSKIHRVPFGEYVPFKDWLPFMNQFAPYSYDYSVHAGDTLTRFPLQGMHFGMLICYEDTDPALARGYVEPHSDLPKADFLLNISNDGWFNGTSEHEEHLAICRFRAVESRRAVARAVNMGISAIIDSNGRVLAPKQVAGDNVWSVPDNAPALATTDWAKFKKIAGVVVGAMPIDQRTSLYAAWGDWLPWACWLVIGAALLWCVKSRLWPRAV